MIFELSFRRYEEDNLLRLPAKKKKKVCFLMLASAYGAVEYMSITFANNETKKTHPDTQQECFVVLERGLRYSDKSTIKKISKCSGCSTQPTKVSCSDDVCELLKDGRTCSNKIN